MILSLVSVGLGSSVGWEPAGLTYVFAKGVSDQLETRWLQEIPFSKELTDNYLLCSGTSIFESIILCNNNNSGDTVSNKLCDVHLTLVLFHTPDDTIECLVLFHTPDDTIECLVLFHTPDDTIDCLAARDCSAVVTLRLWSASLSSHLYFISGDIVYA